MSINLHSIESFGTVDGPGVRFVIFTQGCPLRCAYCHNPDTWDCSCGTHIEINDLLKQIEDVSFFIKKGGITVSGGEPMLQAKEIIPLFKELKNRNIHTCIDTSGFIKRTKHIDELLSLTDLVLLDIKHIDDSLHKELTSVSNKNTLDFAKHLNDINKPVWIRHVLVPTINDSEQDLTNLKQFIDTLSNVEKIELLPYHDLGVFKWKSLNMDYKLSHIKPPSKESIEKAKKILNIKKDLK